MPDERLKKLLEKRNSMNALIRQQQNKHKNTERKADTRRKVLAGATVLQWAAKDSDFSAKLHTELKAFLVKDADRQLFGFPPLKPKE